MKGRRYYPDKSTLVSEMRNGDYWIDEKMGWMVKTPNGMIGWLRDHSVIAHEDGTITVSPSILISDGIRQWHGYLSRGMWREV